MKTREINRNKLAGFFNIHFWIILSLIVLFVLGTATVGFAAKQSTSEALESKKLLSELGYWTGPVDRVRRAEFQHALIAFQKVEDRKRTGSGRLQWLMEESGN